MKDLLFIDLIDETGRVSSLGVYGKKKQDDLTITVIGGLSHGLDFAPKSIDDANRLIAWLEEWKAKNESV